MTSFLPAPVSHQRGLPLQTPTVSPPRHSLPSQAATRPMRSSPPPAASRPCSRRQTLSYTMGNVALTSPLNASTVTASPLTFTWQAFAGATGYHLQVSTSSKFGTGTFPYTTATTSYDLDTSVLIPGKTYYWRVYADIPTGTSMYSPTWKFIYKKATKLSLAYVGIVRSDCNAEGHSYRSGRDHPDRREENHFLREYKRRR